jgi:hypothetical protein
MCSCSDRGMRRSLPVAHFDFSRQFGAGVRPIAPHHLAVLLGRHAVRQLLASRAAIDVLGSIGDEVLLAETASLARVSPTLPEHGPKTGRERRTERSRGHAIYGNARRGSIPQSAVYADPATGRDAAGCFTDAALRLSNVQKRPSSWKSRRRPPVCCEGRMGCTAPYDPYASAGMPFDFSPAVLPCDFGPAALPCPPPQKS